MYHPFKVFSLCGLTFGVDMKMLSQFISFLDTHCCDSLSRKARIFPFHTITIMAPGDTPWAIMHWKLCWYAFHVFHLTLRKMTVFNNLLSTSHYVSWYLFSFSSLHKSAYLRFLYDHIWRLIDGLIQKRHTYNGNALQLRLICIKLSICNDAVRQFSSSSLMHHPDT